MFVAIKIVVEVEYVREGKPIVDFVATFGEVVKVKSLNHNVEQFWKLDEPSSPLSSDFFVADLAVVKVVLI